MPNTPLNCPVTMLPTTAVAAQEMKKAITVTRTVRLARQMPVAPFRGPGTGPPPCR